MISISTERKHKLWHNVTSVDDDDDDDDDDYSDVMSIHPSPFPNSANTKLNPMSYARLFPHPPLPIPNTHSKKKELEVTS